jgi:toxin YoeB
MNIIFSEESWKDYLYWEETDKKKLKRINELIKDIQRSNYKGIGKPEPLKYQLQGCWSRRIDNEHRIVYEIVYDELRIVSCRFHY